jgi:predicted ATPase
MKESRKELDSMAVRAKLEAQSITLNKLHFSDSELDGRDFESQRLHSRLTRFVHQPVTSLVSISGISGTGKTALAKQLRKPTLKTGGFFCLGKFDLNVNRAQPYLAFARTSHDLAEQIQSRENKSLRPKDNFQQRIQEAVGEQGVHLLLEVFPGLSRVLPPPSDSEVIETSIKQKTYQLQFALSVSSFAS